VAAKWHELGTELFDEEEGYKLDTIESNYSKDAVKCCREMFHLWLNANANAEWYQIVEALRSPGVCLASVADELEKEFNCKN